MIDTEYFGNRLNEIAPNQGESSDVNTAVTNWHREVIAILDDVAP